MDQGVGFIPAAGKLCAVSMDVDGTLYDIRAHMLRVGIKLLPGFALWRAWSRAVKLLRGARYEDLMARIYRQVASEMGTTVHEVEESLRWLLDDQWADSLRPDEVRPGVIEALSWLDSKSIPRAVASDLPAERKLKALGIENGWSVVVAGTEIGALKPDPTMIIHVARTMTCSPASLLHIGDRMDTDGEAARRAGAGFLLFPGPETRRTSLLEVLKKLFGCR